MLYCRHHVIMSTPCYNVVSFIAIVWDVVWMKREGVNSQSSMSRSLDGHRWTIQLLDNDG